MSVIEFLSLHFIGFLNDLSCIKEADRILCNCINVGKENKINVRGLYIVDNVRSYSSPDSVLASSWASLSFCLCSRFLVIPPTLELTCSPLFDLDFSEKTKK